MNNVGTLKNSNKKKKKVQQSAKWQSVIYGIILRIKRIKRKLRFRVYRESIILSDINRF